MTSVESVSIDSVEDKQIVLSNSQWAAKLSDSLFGGWTSLRIAWRMTMDDTEASLAGDLDRFYIGLMSNPVEDMTNGPLTTNTNHFVGVRSNLEYTRVPGPPIQYTNTGALGFHFLTRVGATEVLSSSAVVYVPGRFIYCTGQNLRGCNVIEITKGSPNFTMNVIGCGLSFTEVDIPYSVLAASCGADKTLAQVATALNTYVNEVSEDSEVTYQTGLTRTVAVDEDLNGELNAVVFAWKESTPMRISEVLVVKVA